MVKATIQPAEGAPGEPFVMRLKFDPQTFTLWVKAYDGPQGRVRVKDSKAAGMALEFLEIGKSA